MSLEYFVMTIVELKCLFLSLGFSPIHRTGSSILIIYSHDPRACKSENPVDTIGTNQ